MEQEGNECEKVGKNWCNHWCDTHTVNRDVDFAVDGLMVMVQRYGYVAIGHQSGVIQLRDAYRGGLLWSVCYHVQRIRVLQYTMDEGLLSVSRDGVMKKTDIKTSKELWSVRTGKHVSCVAELSNQTIAVGCEDGEIHIFEWNGEHLAIWVHGGNPISCMLSFPLFASFAYGHKNTIKIHYTEKSVYSPGKKIVHTVKNTWTVDAFAICPYGDKMAVLGGEHLSLYTVNSIGKWTLEWTIPHPRGKTITWSSIPLITPLGTDFLLATIDTSTPETETIQVISPLYGDVLESFSSTTPKPNPILSVAFSPSIHSKLIIATNDSVRPQDLFSNNKKIIMAICNTLTINQTTHWDTEALQVILYRIKRLVLS